MLFNRYPQTDQSLAAQYARAIATYRKSGVRSAMPLVDTLIAAKPNWPYFYEIKGQFLFESGNPAAAVAPLRQAVNLAPNEPLIRVMLGQALLGTNDAKLVDEAITNLRTALAREDSSAMGYRQLAAAYARKGGHNPGSEAPRSSSWRKPSLHRRRPISMKGSSGSPNSRPSEPKPDSSTARQLAQAPTISSLSKFRPPTELQPPEISA